MKPEAARQNFVMSAGSESRPSCNSVRSNSVKSAGTMSHADRRYPPLSRLELRAKRPEKWGTGSGRKWEEKPEEGSGKRSESDIYE